MLLLCADLKRYRSQGVSRDPEVPSPASCSMHRLPVASLARGTVSEGQLYLGSALSIIPSISLTKNAVYFGAMRAYCTEFHFSSFA